MSGSWLFLAAYAFSGLAGLIYEVSWTRLVTLYMGHTVAESLSLDPLSSSARQGLADAQHAIGGR